MCEKDGRQDVADAIRKIAQSTVIIPGMKEFIEERKKEGFELHLATNQFAQGFDVYKKRHPEFFALFDYAYVGTPAQGDKKKLQKPHLDYYKDYLAKTPSNKPYRFFWDDKKANVNAAKEVGIDGAVFTTAKQAEKDFKKNFSIDATDHTATTHEQPQPIMP
jgi:FMN phosphatase YigB (HAD superfamily)